MSPRPFRLSVEFKLNSPFDFQGIKSDRNKRVHRREHSAQPIVLFVHLPNEFKSRQFYLQKITINITTLSALPDQSPPTIHSPFSSAAGGQKFKVPKMWCVVKTKKVWPFILENIISYTAHDKWIKSWNIIGFR